METRTRPVDQTPPVRIAPGVGAGLHASLEGAWARRPVKIMYHEASLGTVQRKKHGKKSVRTGLPVTHIQLTQTLIYEHQSALDTAESCSSSPAHFQAFSLTIIPLLRNAFHDIHAAPSVPDPSRR